MNKYKVIDDADYLIDENQLKRFALQIREMARKEFGVDADGDSLVEVEVTDRTRYWSNQNFPIAYDHKAKTDAEHDMILRDLMSNLEHAAASVKQKIDWKRYRRELVKKV